MPALLEALDEPMTARALAERLGFTDDEAVTLLNERLAELVDAGLVRRS